MLNTGIVNIDLIIQLSKNKKTTVEDILNRFREMVEAHRTKIEDAYVNERANQIKKTNRHLSQDQLLDISKSVVSKINVDIRDYVEDYVTNITDDILDAINSKLLSRRIGYNLLSLFQSINQLYKENFKEADV